MHAEGILHPVVSYVLLALSLGLCTFLFLTLKRDLRVLEKKHARQCRQLAACLEQMGTRLGEIERQFREVEEQVSAAPTFTPPRPGVNLTRRTQILRMFRRGERPEQIAAALSVPQNEVDLLLKVHRVAQRG